MSGRRQSTVVVLGLMGVKPWAGVVWQTLHYLLGFRLLGFDVYYLEAHGCYPHIFARDEVDDGALGVASFIDRTLRPYGLQGSWAFQALHSDGRCYGLSEGELARVLGRSDAIINLHGGTLPRPEHYRGGRLVYLETDPVQPQIELAEGLRETWDFLSLHSAWFSFAENYGGVDCPLPVFEAFPFQPTRQPVVLDLWQEEREPRPVFTTVGNWRQLQREVTFRGELYHWSKHYEFLKFLDLPQRSGAQFELALSTSSLEAADRELLQSYGWRVVDSLGFSADPSAYRGYLLDSGAEFTVAKDQNVRLNTGWFSDRSATYLAAGRPVVTQETGFSSFLPAGEGLFGYGDLDGALTAVEQVLSDSAGQRRAAREIARTFFAHDVVLGRLLDGLGLRAHTRSLP